MTFSCPVFYTPKMVADSLSESPSAAKPAAVVASWARQFNISVMEPTPVGIEDIALAHDRQWAEEILASKRENGFGNTSAEVAKSLVYTSGSMLSAARHALDSKSAAAAPCSGFHHAGFKTAQGFCTFNGLMIATLVLQKEHPGLRVGILDLDMHYGNGTDEILRKVGQLNATHYTAGAYYTDPLHAYSFFSVWLPEVLTALSKCDIVLYQAGADPHIDDPHGGWLTTEQLQKRDAIVFEALKKAGVPVAWNLAGGYQVEEDGSIPKVLEIHDNTMRECVRVFGAVWGLPGGRV
jgi:acetoin utilization deacetylase AcuC-like enzyme